MGIIKHITLGIASAILFTPTLALMAYTKELPLEVQRVRKIPQPHITQPKPSVAPENRNNSGSVELHHLHTPPKKYLAFTFETGSLKENIERIAKAYGWLTVVWKPDNDYQWVGTAHFSGNDLAFILNDVLQNYPLQAVFYRSNHVLLITPRNIK